ncbi:MAG: DUF6807 family protein [Planctomycetota bacterium]
MMITNRFLPLICLFLLPCASFGQQAAWEITLTSKHDAVNVPVRVPISEAFNGTMRIRRPDAEGGDFLTLAVVTAPRLLNHDENVGAEICFVLPAIKAGEELKLIAAEGTAKAMSMNWNPLEGKFNKLSYGGRGILQYMHESPDRSSKDRLMETYKVYHHVFNPKGDVLLTKGAGGLFPHHRGLFFGFNRISYDGGKKKADVWHCKNGETQEHVKVLEEVTGPVMGRHQVAIDWYGRDREVFAKEKREITAYAVAGGQLIEFATRLESQVGPVRLDGDPQHAGFQWRSTQHVPDKTKKLTYYLRPDGKGMPGKFRNWPQQKDHVNLPWHALSIVVNDQRYTICYLDRPENPKESRFSERDYGRFGSYFEFDLDTDRPLELNYRIWVQEGEMTVQQVAALSANFVEPVSAVATRMAK